MAVLFHNISIPICLFLIFKCQHAIDHARFDIIENGGVSVTNVTWVMVVTWSEMVPRMYYWPMHDFVSGNNTAFCINR